MFIEIHIGLVIGTSKVQSEDSDKQLSPTPFLRPCAESTDSCQVSEIK